MRLLRKLFRRNTQDDAWTQFAGEIGGVVKMQLLKSGFLGNEQVLVRVKNWTLTLDTYAKGGSSTAGSTIYTRMRAPYVAGHRLQFELYRERFLSRVRKRLGMQGIQVGHPEFDRSFIISGNDGAKIRELFAKPRIRELIQAQPWLHLQVEHLQGQVDQLTVEEMGVITDVQRLKLLFELIVETLEQLVEIGSASEDDPQVIL